MHGAAVSLNRRAHGRGPSGQSGRKYTMPLTPALLVAAVLAGADGKAGPHQPPFATVDLDRNESQEVRLADGTRAKVKLLAVEDARDSLRSALRLARVRVEINGCKVTLASGNYRLPE